MGEYPPQAGEGVSLPLVTLTSDFGTGSPYVAAMKAAVLAACPSAVLVDATHDVPAFDVEAGSFLLWAATRGFPAGSVHLAVVDPGVGGERRALALESGGSFYVGPDNGLFTRVVGGGEFRAVSLDRPVSATPTFEGRDVFAPAAGALAAGRPLESLGSAVSPLVTLPPGDPRVLWVDSFGNLVTNLTRPLSGLVINGRRVARSARTYSDAPAGEPFWYEGSLGLVEVGLREGRADKWFGARAGTPIEVLRGS